MFTGCLPDPVDERDRPYGASLATFGSMQGGHYRIPSMRGPLNQRQTWSCPGHAWARWLTTGSDLLGEHLPEPSAAFIYAHARLITAGGDWSLVRDGGTNIRNCATVMSKFGIPPATVWPLDEQRINEQPCDRAYLYAHVNRVKLDGYYRLSGADEIEHAIRSNRPVVAGFEIHRGWADPPEVLDVPAFDGVTGRHAVLLDEVYDDGSFGGLNSWGAEWGNQGRFRLTRRYVEKAQDPWTGTLAFER